MAPISTPFDPGRELILVHVRLFGRRHHHRFLFALDTACSETLVRHEALMDIGYQARDGEETAIVTSALSQERGFFLRVTRIEALGHGFDDFRLCSQELHEDTGIDGLLGLNFLRHFNYEIRSREGRIVVAPA